MRHRFDTDKPLPDDKSSESVSFRACPWLLVAARPRCVTSLSWRVAEFARIRGSSRRLKSGDFRYAQESMVTHTGHELGRWRRLDPPQSVAIVTGPRIGNASPGRTPSPLPHSASELAPRG